MPVYTFFGDNCGKNEGIGHKSAKYSNIASLSDEKLLFFQYAFDIILTIENNLGGLNR